MWLWIGIGVASALTPDELLARVDATAPLRARSLLADVAPKIPRDLYRRAAEGGVHTTLVEVPGHSAKQGIGVGVLDVSIERYWAAVNDDASKPDHTKLSFTEVLEGGACGDRRVVFMYLPISLLSDRWWTVEARKNLALLEASDGAVREMTWDRVAYPIPESTAAHGYASSGGVEVQLAKGAWWLTRLDADHTLVEYWTWSDPGGSVPAGIASSFAAGGIKHTFEQMAELARKGAKCPVQ